MKKVELGKEYPGYDTFYGQPGVAFIMADGGKICTDCANRKNGSIAFCATNYGNEDHCRIYFSRDQWRIVGSQYMERGDYDVNCDHCGQIIQPGWIPRNGPTI